MSKLICLAAFGWFAWLAWCECVTRADELWPVPTPIVVPVETEEQPEPRPYVPSGRGWMG